MSAPATGAVAQAFAAARRDRRAAFIPYLAAGDPDLERSGELLRVLVDAGADILELGVPFSDPIADGPVNQRAATRSLAAGTTLSGVLDLVARHRDELGVPVVLFTYFNPLLARGLEVFAEQASSSGVDGVLCVDLPPDEAAEEYLPALRAQNLDTIFLLAPTSDRSRVQEVGRCSTGFAYYVSRTGVTGPEGGLPDEVLTEVKRLRRRLPLPLAVGFGIASPEQAAAVGRVADGVVVGSALVRTVEELGEDPELPAALGRQAAELRRALGGKRR